MERRELEQIAKLPEAVTLNELGEPHRGDDGQRPPTRSPFKKLTWG
jgi:hypothetical protein